MRRPSVGLRSLTSSERFDSKMASIKNSGDHCVVPDTGLRVLYLTCLIFARVLPGGCNIPILRMRKQAHEVW